MDTFLSRREVHDKIAIPYVQDRLKEYGLRGIPYGVEEHDKDLQKALMRLGRSDNIALKDRYKPDLYIVSGPDELKINPNVPPILCEVKSESRGHKNFSIEFDSYCAAKMWSEDPRNVLYVFVRITGNKVDCSKSCWVNDVPVYMVNVPDRFDFDRNMAELTEKYPNVYFREVPYNNGAGTPYFLIPGNASYFEDFDCFLGELTGIETQPTQLVLFD